MVLCRRRCERMTVAVSFIFLSALASLVKADTCYTDITYNVYGWKSGPSWVASNQVVYNRSQGSNPNLAEKILGSNPEKLHVTVNQCNNMYCTTGSTVEILTSTERKEMSGRILPDYDFFPGIGNYKFHTDPKTWDEARKICNNEGGHLAVINSEQESKIFADYMAGFPDGVHAYIGFHDRFQPGVFLTIFDEPLRKTGFYRWANVYLPRILQDSETCGTVDANGGLNCIACDNKSVFICEQQMC